MDEDRRGRFVRRIARSASAIRRSLANRISSVRNRPSSESDVESDVEQQQPRQSDDTATASEAERHSQSRQPSRMRELQRQSSDTATASEAERHSQSRQPSRMRELQRQSSDTATASEAERQSQPRQPSQRLQPGVPPNLSAGMAYIRRQAERAIRKMSDRRPGEPHHSSDSRSSSPENQTRRPSIFSRIARSANEARRSISSRLNRFLLSSDSDAEREDNAGQAVAAIDRVRRRRASETPSEREARLNRTRERRAEETEENRAANVRAASNRRTLRNQSLSLNLYMAAFNYNPEHDYPNHPLIVLGELDNVCKFCGARCFKGESKGLCCCEGKVRIDPIEQPPEPTLSLFSGDNAHPFSKNFLKHIRKYNSCFQMTSFGVTGNRESHWSTFKIQGQIYHRFGSLLPMPNEQPKYLQVFFVGGADEQINIRSAMHPDINRQVIRYLQSMLDEQNELVRTFRTALDRMPSDEHRVVIRADRTPAGEHVRRFNAPTIDEIAIVVVEGQTNSRDIVIERRNDRLKRISEMHPSYDALQYPIIFWRGCDTYNFDMKQINPVTGALTNAKVSTKNYYAHQLMIRRDHQNFILKCRALLNQYVVDMYAKIEAERLRYIRLNQNALRAEEYVHLRDALVNDGNADNVGQHVILPSTFIGSPRHMHEYAQDAMAYVRLHGRPDLFITFTCNPNWEEIKKNLLPGQINTDRHDLVSRIFKRKQVKLMDVITKHRLFGPTKCYMSSIEWQKRGLPHSHTLVWLENRVHPQDIDSIITAELPSSTSDPVLFEIVSRQMIHGPCGVLNPQCPCMNGRVCTKNYPREMISETKTGEEGYPLYRRRSPENGGKYFEIRRGSNDRIRVDNSWVVPHNPVLCRMFDAHINVEYCNSVKSIKYICKYINKGSDMAVLEHSTNRNDEVAQYQLGRYISSNEAFWRIFSFPIHERHPAVVHLSVHLENGQRVYFRPDNAAAVVANPPNTTLTAFFLLCQSDSYARTLLYADVPRFYTWNQSRKTFERRKRGRRMGEGIFEGDAIGRLYAVHPSQQECFYLRILLGKVRGPTSFRSLRTVDNVDCGSFREACLRRGLLEHDLQWQHALSEGAATRMPAQLRSLFSVIVTSCSPSNPDALWQMFKHDLSEDLLLQQRRANPALRLDFSELIFNQALILIEDICLRLCGKVLRELGLPSPNRSALDPSNSEVTRETSYDIESLIRYYDTNLPMLVTDQRSAFDEITEAIDEDCGGFFFIDAPGGTGKTFLLNLLLAHVRRRGDIILATASSGIAATLLQGGATAHSMFKMSVKFTAGRATCNISRGSAKCQLLQHCKAIIWDEATMANRKLLEALDRTLKDLRRDNSLMGGVVVVLAGDFRQTLPVIRRGTPADELDACIKNSPLWRLVNKFRLTTNMRALLRGELGAAVFSNKLLQIGNGTYPSERGSELIKLLPDMCQPVSTLDELVERVFPNLQNNLNDSDWLAERAILAPLNEAVDSLNQTIQDRLTGLERQYMSVDTTVEPEQAVHFPTEFLNSLTPSGFPLHWLRLKVGSPIMVMRNLDPPKLCNGTRLRVIALRNNLIEAKILVGQYKGQTVLIPRIPFITDKDDMAFEFKRLQFPVRLAYAMTINKSQGQSLRVAGLQLIEPCFSHGQLYVACSRVGSPNGLIVLAPSEGTRNVVYRQALG